MRIRKGAHLIQGRLPSECDNFDRQRERAELLHMLAGVGDHDHPGRRGSHDLFPCQRATAAFDETQITVQLIGAVDCQVEPRRLLQGRQGNVEAGGLFVGRFRRWYAQHLKPVDDLPHRGRSTNLAAVDPVPRPRRIPGNT